MKKKNVVLYLFCFVLHFAFGRNFQVSALGHIYSRRDLTEGFLHYKFGGLIFVRAYTWRGLVSEFYGSMFWRNKICKCVGFCLNIGRSCMLFNVDVYANENKSKCI